MSDINGGTLLGGIGLIITALSGLIAVLKKVNDKDTTDPDNDLPNQLAVLDYRVGQVETEVKEIKKWWHPSRRTPKT